jgi:hypothetical protein
MLVAARSVDARLVALVLGPFGAWRLGKLLSATFSITFPGNRLLAS